eukprot:8610859-Heterocapsa_arctica.AAC.1
MRAEAAVAGVLAQQEKVTRAIKSAKDEEAAARQAVASATKRFEKLVKDEANTQEQEKDVTEEEMVALRRCQENRNRPNGL